MDQGTGFLAYPLIADIQLRDSAGITPACPEPPGIQREMCDRLTG